MKRVICPLLLVSVLCSNAWAEDFPARKPGLWEIQTTANAAGPAGGTNTMLQCIDEASDKKLQEMGKSMGSSVGINCSLNEFRKEGPNYVNETKCQMGPTQISSKSVMTGDFNVAYTGETNATYTPPLMGMSNVTTKLSATYKGPCAADQKPGDMVMQGGMKMNVFDMASGIASGKGGELSGAMQRLQGMPKKP